jgi:hypothetical protein
MRVAPWHDAMTAVMEAAAGAGAAAAESTG